VHAYEDPGRPEGGHAVVLLHGLTKAPNAPTFRLKPADASVGADASGWPQGDLKPIASRVTPEGLELQIGPEITESELLLAGTLVEIEVQAAGARGEFLWPNIAPVLRPKRRTVIVNGPKRKATAAETTKTEGEAADAATGDSKPEPEAAVTAAEAQPAAPSDDKLPAPEPAAKAETSPAETASPAATAPAASILDQLSALDDIANDAAPPAATAPPPAPAPTKPPLPAPVSAAAAILRGAAPVTSAPPAAFGAGSGGLRGTATSTPPATLRGGLITAPEPQARSAAPVRPGRAETNPGFYPHARDSRIPDSRGNAAAASRRNANLAQALIGVVAMGAALFVLSRESSIRTVAPQPAGDAATTVALAPPPSAPASAPATGRAGTPADTAATASPAAPQLMFDTLAVGAISPRGASGAGVSPSRALENANAQLTGPSRDADEAGFWLRRYITQTLGNDRTQRALTQLGSVYAEPSSGAPDYVKARLLWEIASASGDPVAMCFLGLLSENGLGGPADRKAALSWYERSKQSGGCPGVDDSIARVRQ
jgi:hypothetical protein